MSTNKHIDKICCVVLVFTLLVTVLFVNAEHFGVQKASAMAGYETRLFDTSYVHSIDIVMDDWDGFLETCSEEEYSGCTVVIDGEAYKNVAIRAKGNTSLTQVESYGNNRYSFKIEFDHYDNANTYYGLDKLCLNNMIQDNTYMKDYLTYQMMAEMGVASPLCSYVNITVNNELWGLYLAVEGVEESFLRRNYGNDYGELYKPDSMDMGGGRGNGKDFDMDGWEENFGAWAAEPNAEAPGNSSENSTGPDTSSDTQNTLDSRENIMPPGQGQRPDGTIQNGSTMPNGNQMPDSSMPNGDRMPDSSMPNGNQMPGGSPPPGFPENPDGITGRPPEGMPQEAADKPTDGMSQESTAALPNVMPWSAPGGVPGQMAMGSDDVLLKYIDDELDSYSNIFENAKTDITDSDKERLISSLENLSSGEDLENTVDIESVIRYFVVHNFVLNFDSYTGGMIHNYYLYEEDGQMEMIPWDYNLAFGGFESAGGAKSLANYPIDSPVSGGSAEDRPMLAWIFADEEYTGLYHQYFAEFISDYFDSGKFTEMMDSVKSMISPYVEDDPAKFCTFEEFTTGIDTLKEFCLLRAQSIQGQLDGTIGSTSETQEESTWIDTGDIEITDMGSMNMGMMNPMGGSMGNPAENRTGNEPGLPPGDRNDMPIPDESGSGQSINP